MIDLNVAADLYERFGKPLEADHLDQYVAIFQDGATVLGATMIEVANRAVERHGRGAVVFKVGEGAAGRWRSLSR